MVDADNDWGQLKKENEDPNPNWRMASSPSPTKKAKIFDSPRDFSPPIYDVRPSDVRPSDQVPVQTTSTEDGAWHLCSTFLAADGGDPWEKALHSTGQAGWAKTHNSKSTNQKSMTQKCTMHQGIYSDGAVSRWSSECRGNML